MTLLDQLTASWGASLEIIEESDDELVAAVTNHQTDRLRYAAVDRVPTELRRAAAEHFVYIADAPVISHGRIELLWYLLEQSISVDYHRYGNLGGRSQEERAKVD